MGKIDTGRNGAVLGVPNQFEREQLQTKESLVGDPYLSVFILRTPSKCPRS